jgi:acetylornithine deacetylase/succinyl-diaminopimelate desuccinylase-like protein
VLADELTSLGFEARVAPTQGHPMVVAHHDGDGPHILFYGHYDVQPIDPLELWKRDPFDPVLETRADGSKAIVGRGASDDKGQLRTFVEACRAWKETEGRLPCRVTILFEGEEEIGIAEPRAVPPRQCRRAQGRFRADLRHLDVGHRHARLTIGLRGMAGGQVTVRGAFARPAFGALWRPGAQPDPAAQPDPCRAQGCRRAGDARRLL